MALPKAKQREIRFLLLYSYIVNPSVDYFDTPIIKLISEQLKVSISYVRNEEDFFSSFLIHKETLAMQIARESEQSYVYERITTIEKTVLLLISFELIIQKVEPMKVLLAEAVRLTKKFSTESGVPFVLGVLDAIYKKVDTPIEEK